MSLAASLAIYAQQAAKADRLESELVQKSIQAEAQRQLIEGYSLEVEALVKDLEGKAEELAALEGELGRLAQEVESQGTQIAEKTALASSLENQVLQLETQVTALESEQTVLLSEISAKEQSLALGPGRVHVAHYGLGVDDDGMGLVFRMEAEIIDSGEGRISMNIGNVVFQSSFQDSVRTAAAVAADYTGVSVSDKDIIVTLVNESDRLITADGPSAGAAITAIIIAGLQDKQLDPSVLVTGSIRPDGTVGTVGGIAGKAEAAAAFGAETLLVPKNQQFHSSQIEVLGVADVEDIARLMIKD